MSKKASSESRRNSDATAAMAPTDATTPSPEVPVPGATHRSRSSRGHQAPSESGAMPRHRSDPGAVATDATAPRRGRRGSGTMTSSSATGHVNLAPTEQLEETTTTTTTIDTETSSSLFGSSKPSRGWPSRKRSSGSKKAKSAEAHGSSVAAADFGVSVEETILSKPSKHHSSPTKSSSVPDLPPMQPPPPDAPLPESKAVTSERSCGFKRHQHVPSAPVQSPETGGDGGLPRSMTPAVVAPEQPYTTPNKKMPDLIAAELAEALPSETKGVANDHPKATKSYHHAPVAPAQTPDSANHETCSPPLDAESSQEPPTASKRMPEQPAPAASDRSPETQHQHSALVPINGIVSEATQLSTPTNASTDLWVVPFTGSLPAITESPISASGAGCASVPFEVDVAPAPQHAAQQEPQKAAPGPGYADSVLSPKSAPGSSTMEATGFKRGLICAIIIGFLILLLIFVLPLGPPRPKISSTAPVGPPSSSTLP